MPKEITVDIVSDTVCPWCYIGKRRFEQALAQCPADLDIYVSWRPFQLNPDIPAEGKNRRVYLATKFGGDEQAKRIYQTIRDAGNSVELDFDFEAMDRQPNTINSHRLIGRAGQLGMQDVVVECLFQAFFMDGKDIGDIRTLVEIANNAGMDIDETLEYLESNEDVERVHKEDLVARQMGIQGVPCFIINRKYHISGAQDPEVFLKAFEQVMTDEDNPAKPALAKV